MALTPEVSRQIDADMELGRKVGVEGTPTIFVNGKLAQERSFDYFVEGKTLARYRYSNAFLRKREALIGFEGRSVIQRAIARWANGDPERYERKFAWILPAEKINFVLEVVK